MVARYSTSESLSSPATSEGIIRRAPVAESEAFAEHVVSGCHRRDSIRRMERPDEWVEVNVGIAADVGLDAVPDLDPVPSPVVLCLGLQICDLHVSVLVPVAAQLAPVGVEDHLMLIDAQHRKLRVVDGRESVASHAQHQGA